MLQEGNGPLHVYVVSEVFRTDPNDLEVLRKSDYDKLTLITCDSWSYESEAYEQRLVVVAQPVGTLDTTTSITSSETLN
jgi:sortase (surface protein transpeptidase)